MPAHQWPRMRVGQRAAQARRVGSVRGPNQKQQGHIADLAQKGCGAVVRGNTARAEESLEHAPARVEGPALTRPTLARGRRTFKLDPASDRGSDYHVLVAAERVRGLLI